MCLFHCIPSVHPSLPIYSTQECLPQRHHCWKVSCFCCLSLWFGHLAFSRRLGKQGLLYLAQILTSAIVVPSASWFTYTWEDILHTEHKGMDAKMNSFQGEGDTSDLMWSVPYFKKKHVDFYHAEYDLIPNGFQGPGVETICMHKKPPGI